jgi:pimeloyl-ACP methyl ester carboxylesterase
MEERKFKGIGYIAGRWPLEPAKSTLMFIHGAGGSSAFWKAQVAGLAERANTIAVDLPGHGRSEGDGKDRVEDYAREVAGFIREIQAPAPIPCGLSMGGAVTQLLLLDYPDSVKAGILISTGARLKVAPLIFETIEKNYSDYVEMVCQLAASKKTNPKLLQPFKDETARCRPVVAYGDFQACNNFDVTARLASIELPVLVVTAADDLLTPLKYGDFLEKNIQHASRAHVLDAGHLVPMEQPQEVNRHIIEFLDRAGL